MSCREVAPLWAGQYARLWIAKMRFPGTEVHTGAIHPTARFGAGCIIHREARVAAGVRLGCRCTVGPRAVLEPRVAMSDGCVVYDGAHLGEDVSLGDYSYVNEGSLIGSGRVGRYSSIGPGVFIGLPEHAADRFSTAPSLGGALEKEPPVIENDVWIGARAIVLRGIKVHTGAVIAAGSVVTRDVQPYEIVGGAPARTLKERAPRAVAERLLATKWWELPHETVCSLVHRLNALQEWSDRASAAEAFVLASRESIKSQ